MARCFLSAMLILGALILPPAAARADQRQYANVIYQVPDRWDVGGADDGRQVLMSDLPDDKCQFCYIYIGRGAPGDGDVAGFLDAHKTDFIEDEQDRAAAKVLGSPSQFDLGGHKGALVAQLAGDDLQIFAALAVGDRTQTFGFKGPAYDEATLAATMEVFQSAFFPLVENAAYVSEGAPSLLPAAVAGDLSGLWWGTETQWLMGIDGMMQMHIYHTTLIFWPDGHFYNGTPPGGLKPVDRTALTEAGDTSFGVYSASGDDLTLTYADGHSDQARRDGTSITLGATQTWPVEPLADGEAIGGTIESFFYSGFTPGSGVVGGASAASYTTFHKDGTYEGASSGGAFANFEMGGDLTGGFAANSGDTHGGTYEIRDGLVISTPADGSGPRAALVFRAGDDILVGDKYLKTD